MADLRSKRSRDQWWQEGRQVWSRKVSKQWSVNNSEYDQESEESAKLKIGTDT